MMNVHDVMFLPIMYENITDTTLKISLISRLEFFNFKYFSLQFLDKHFYRIIFKMIITCFLFLSTQHLSKRPAPLVFSEHIQLKCEEA